MGAAVAEVASLSARIAAGTGSAGAAGAEEAEEAAGLSDLGELAEVIELTSVTGPAGLTGAAGSAGASRSAGAAGLTKVAEAVGLTGDTYAPERGREHGRERGLVALLADGAVRSGREVGPGSGVVSDAGLLPVLPAFRDLLPAGALQRGSVVSAGSWSMLCLALAAGPVASGAWCAAAGIAELGVAAAADAGLDPARLLLVPDLGSHWHQVVASLLDGCDLVLLRPPERPSAQVRRKLEATVRRYGGVLLVAGDWDGAQVRLRIASRAWAGVGLGHGRLRGRRVQVVADGRGGWSRPQARWLWLPGPDGTVTPVAQDELATLDRPAAGYPTAGQLVGHPAVGYASTAAAASIG